MKEERERGNGKRKLTAVYWGVGGGGWGCIYREQPLISFFFLLWHLSTGKPYARPLRGDRDPDATSKLGAVGKESRYLAPFKVHRVGTIMSES